MESTFHVHRTLRTAIVTSAQSSLTTLPRLRKANARIASWALRVYGEELNKGSQANRSTLFRSAVTYYVHELASLTPEALGEAKLLGPEHTLSSIDLQTFSERLLAQDANEGERFSHALIFRQRVIQPRHGGSRC